MKPKAMKLLASLNTGDGFLSSRVEWHAFALGWFDGMKSWRVRPKKMRDNEDVQAETHYYAGGYAIGTLVQGILVILAAVVYG